MSTATVTRVSLDGLQKDFRKDTKRTNSDGSKSASELYDKTGGAATLKGDVQSENLPYEPVSEIDNKDVGTPDQWIPRHPDLIRLTGRCDDATTALKPLYSPVLRIEAALMPKINSEVIHQSIRRILYNDLEAREAYAPSTRDS